MGASQAEQWKIWAEHMDTGFHHVFDLLWMRHMWKTTDTILSSASAPDSGAIQNHLTTTYVIAICLLIRRETDRSNSTSSYTRQLSVLASNPGLVSRSTYAGCDGEFDTYAPNGAERIDPDLVRADIAVLSAAAKPVKTYTDKIIAHHERFGRNALLPTLDYGQIDSVLAQLGSSVQKYWPLTHAGSQLARTTPADDRQWFNAFTVPWIRPMQTIGETKPPS